jgi:hypothetical protein
MYKLTGFEMTLDDMTCAPGADESIGFESNNDVCSNTGVEVFDCGSAAISIGLAQAEGTTTLGD